MDILSVRIATGRQPRFQGLFPESEVGRQRFSSLTLLSNLTCPHCGASTRTSFWLAYKTWKPFERQLLPWPTGRKVCFLKLVHSDFTIPNYKVQEKQLQTNLPHKTCIFPSFFLQNYVKRRTDKKWEIIFKFKPKGPFYLLIINVYCSLMLSLIKSKK